jgi:hypothetical protein
MPELAELRKIVGELNEAWIRQQLKDIEKLQRSIVLQQSKADENLAELQKISAIVLAKIDDLDDLMGGSVSYVIPELEQAIKMVSVRAISIDKQVADLSPEPPEPN